MKAVRQTTVRIGTLVLFLSGAALIASAETLEQNKKPSVAPAMTPQQRLVAGNNDFAFDLYARLRQANPDNIVVSPYSVSVALSMTWAGARGETAKEMERVLRFTPPTDRVHDDFAVLIGRQNAKYFVYPGFDLAVVNALWPLQGYSFDKNYVDLLRIKYNAGFKEMDYVGAAEPSRKEINRWVEERTGGKIKDLLPPFVVDNNTRLVLTNALFLKGDWTKPFSEDATRKGAFHLSGTKSIEVPMMFQADTFGYTDDKELQAVELPIGKGEAYSMYIILPKSNEGLPALEKALTNARFETLRARMTRQRLVLSMPKFKVESSFSLADQLRDLGMPTAFSGQADFSGMTGKRGLFISAVLHKAFLDVHEKGIEAAAATAVVMRESALPQLTFRANHPFFYVIRERSSGSILFMGRVTNPRG